MRLLRSGQRHANDELRTLDPLLCYLTKLRHGSCGSYIYMSSNHMFLMQPTYEILSKTSSYVHVILAFTLTYSYDYH